MEPLAAAGIYVVRTLFGLYIWIVLLRFLLQLARADFYNPISQAIAKVTDPALAPLRRLIPQVAGVDICSLILAVIVQIAAICLVYLLYGQTVPSFILVIGWSLVGLLSVVLNIYFFALLIVIILSWIAPNSSHPGALLVYQITEPIMRPARNLIPAIGGLDLSPIFIFIAINLIEKLVVHTLATSLNMPRQLILGL